MTGSETAFVAIGAVGFLLLAISLVLGELLEHDLSIEHGFEHEVGHAFEHEISHEIGHEIAPHAGDLPSEVGDPAGRGTGLHEPSWLSFRVLAASAVGFGAFGYVADSTGLPAFVSWPVAAGGFAGVGAGTYFAVLKPLARQQYNSLMSRYSYVGRVAVVTLDILPGGSGQVTFHDRQGARVTQTATSDVPDGVAKGAQVRIVDVAGGAVVVHRNLLVD